MKTKDSIVKIWDILKDRMQQDLSETSRIAITCDIWTSKLMNNSYLGNSPSSHGVNMENCNI